MTSPEFYDEVLARIDTALTVVTYGLALVVVCLAIVAVRALRS